MFSRFGFRRWRHATKTYRVETPEGTTLNYELEKAALGSELLEKILAAVDVQPAERRYFGLAVQEGGFMKWMLPNKQLKKQLAGHPPYLLYLRVSLYPRDYHSLQHYSSRRQLFLQVRRDLQENRLRCNTAMTSQLAALVVQVEVGDFSTSSCGAGYLTEVQALPRLNLQLQETVMQLHRINRGKSKRECEEEFLDLAQEEHSYGSQWYSVQDSSHNPVTLMASPSGLKVLRGAIETASFEWDSITKMASKGRNLTIHISRTHTLAAYNSGFSCASSHMARHLTHTLLEMQEFYSSGAGDRPEQSRLKRFFSSRMSMRRRHQPPRRPLEHPSTNPTPRRSGRASGTTLSARRSSYSGALDGVLTFKQEASKSTAVNSPPQDTVVPSPGMPSLDPTSGSALPPTHSRHSSSMDSAALHSRHDSTSLDSFAGTLGDETLAEVKGQPCPQTGATPPGPLLAAPRLTDFIATPILEEPVPTHTQQTSSPQPHMWYDTRTADAPSHEHRASTTTSHSNPRHDRHGSHDRRLSSSSGPHEHHSRSGSYDAHSGSHGYYPRVQDHHPGSHDSSGSHNRSGSHDRQSRSHDHHPGSHDRRSGSHDRHSGSNDSHSGVQDPQRGSQDHNSRHYHHRSGSYDHHNSVSHDRHHSGSYDHRISGSHDHRHSGSHDHYSPRSPNHHSTSVNSQNPPEPHGTSPNPSPAPGKSGHAHPIRMVSPPHHQPSRHHHPPRHRPPPLHSISQPNLDYYRPVHSRPPLPSGRGYNRPSSGGGRSHHRNSPCERRLSVDMPPSHHHNGTHIHMHPSHRHNDIHPHMYPSHNHNGTSHWPIAEDTPSPLPPPPAHTPTRSSHPKEEPWYAPSSPPPELPYTSTPAQEPHCLATRKSRSLPPGISLSLSQPPLPELDNMDSIVQFLDDSLGTASQEDDSTAHPVRTITAAARPQNRGMFRLSLQDASYYDSKQQPRGQGRLKTIHGSQTMLTQGDLEPSMVRLGSIASMELQMSLAELSQASETCLDPHLRSIVFQGSQSQGTEL